MLWCMQAGYALQAGTSSQCLEQCREGLFSFADDEVIDCWLFEYVRGEGVDRFRKGAS